VLFTLVDWQRSTVQTNHLHPITTTPSSRPLSSTHIPTPQPQLRYPNPSRNWSLPLWLVHPTLTPTHAQYAPSHPARAHTPTSHPNAHPLKIHQLSEWDNNCRCWTSSNNAYLRPFSTVCTRRTKDNYHLYVQVPANHLISASIMAAPCALALSKLVHPEKKELRKSTMDAPKMEARFVTVDKTRWANYNEVCRGLFISDFRRKITLLFWLLYYLFT